MYFIKWSEVTDSGGTMVERWSLTGELSIFSTVDLQLTCDYLVGKPSAVDQPTRPTQFFILSGVDN